MKRGNIWMEFFAIFFPKSPQGFSKMDKKNVQNRKPVGDLCKIRRM